MKKKLILLSSLILLSLSSCSSGSFNIVRKVKVIDDTKLYLGCYSSVQTDDGLSSFEVIMYLDFFSKDETRENDSTTYDIQINLAKTDLSTLDDSLVDDGGNPLLFYNMTPYLNKYIGEYKTLGDYFLEGNHLAVFFSYGSLLDEGGVKTNSINIDTAGIYYFSTVTQSGLTPSYSFSKIYTEKVEWVNPFE